MTDYKKLITRLADELDHYRRMLLDDRHAVHALAEEARAALAEDGPAVPEGRKPTDEELWQVGDEDFRANTWPTDAIRHARAVLARWGRPAIKPVPVSERWPEFSDCDHQERVWAWNPVMKYWILNRLNRSIHTHWLPHHALPVPTTRREENYE